MTWGLRESNKNWAHWYSLWFTSRVLWSDLRNLSRKHQHTQGRADRNLIALQQSVTKSLTDLLNRGLLTLHCAVMWQQYTLNIQNTIPLDIELKPLLHYAHHLSHSLLVFSNYPASLSLLCNMTYLIRKLKLWHRFTTLPLHEESECVLYFVFWVWGPLLYFYSVANWCLLRVTVLVILYELQNLSHIFMCHHLP